MIYKKQLKQSFSKKEGINVDKIRSIICCCGQGIGSSMIMEMMVDKALRALGRNDISVSHVSLVDAAKDKGDIYICGLDVAYQLRDYPRVIVLRNLIMVEEIQEKLKRAFTTKEDTFHIE